MEDALPWKIDYHTFDPRVVALFQGISAGTETRAKKVKNFIEVVGALFSAERIKVTWPKRESQLRSLYHTLERRQGPISTISTDLHSVQGSDVALSARSVSNGTERKIDIRRIHRRWAATAAREIHRINASLERAIVDMEALPYREPYEDTPSGNTDPALGPGMAWGYLGEILGAVRPAVREMMDPDLLKEPVILAHEQGDEAAFMAALKETGDDLPGKKERRVLQLGDALAAELEEVARS